MPAVHAEPGAPSTRQLRRRRGDPAQLPEWMLAVLRRVYANRGVRGSRELDYGLARMLPGAGLSGLAEASRLLADAVRQGRRIIVVGDYDADGATSTALAIRAMGALGARSLGYRVPDRFRHGYGLTPAIVDEVQTLGPDLVITVDQGISSLEGVAAARASGLQVIVTDHHLPGPQLPDADAVVNPNMPGEAFPSPHLAGVGVIFYVMLALRARLRAAGWFHERGANEPNMAQFLDLVALGTVADVVSLDHNNRLLVDQGLRRIRAGQCTPGIRALLRVAGRDPAHTTASDLGFAVGPRLNAAGRLEDMAIGIECLLASEEDQGSQAAERLDTLNRERREIEAQMHAEALEAVRHAESAAEGRHGHFGICLYQPGWHEGVIGIVASRLKDRLHRPVVALAAAEDGLLKGSARSIPGLHIRDALQRVAASRPGLLERFGGHAMAAGLSLVPRDLEAFAEAFDHCVCEMLGGELPTVAVDSDGPLAPQEMTLEVATELRYGGPWGQGFPEPVFDGIFHILERRWVGGRHLRLTVSPQEQRQPVEAIAFNADPQDWPEGLEHVQLAYRLAVNRYRGESRLQLVVEARLG